MGRDEVVPYVGRSLVEGARNDDVLMVNAGTRTGRNQSQGICFHGLRIAAAFATITRRVSRANTDIGRPDLSSSA